MLSSFVVVADYRKNSKVLGTTVSPFSLPSRAYQSSNSSILYLSTYLASQSKSPPQHMLTSLHVYGPWVRLAPP